MQDGTIRGYLRNLRLAFFGYLVIITTGILGLVNLPRELMPQIKIPVAVVSVALPGASPQDVEDLITVPIEDAIRSVKGLDTMRASSMENAGMVIAQYKEGYDIDDIVQEIRQKVESVTFPTDAQKPTIMKVDFDEQPVLTISLEGDDLAGLSRLADKIKTELERQSTIDRAEITGLQDREIVVKISPEDLRRYGLHPSLLANSLAAATTNVPAGNLNVDDYTYSVTVQKDVTTIDDIRTLPVLSGGVSTN